MANNKSFKVNIKGVETELFNNPQHFSIINENFGNFTDEEKLKYIEMYINNTLDILSYNFELETHDDEIIQYILNSKYAEKYCMVELKYGTNTSYKENIYSYNGRMFNIFINNIFFFVLFNY
jgi:hypothetical protein